MKPLCKKGLHSVYLLAIVTPDQNFAIALAVSETGSGSLFHCNRINDDQIINEIFTPTNLISEMIGLYLSVHLSVCINF